MKKKTNRLLSKSEISRNVLAQWMANACIYLLPKTGLAFYNYKGTFSIILMAVVSSHKHISINSGSYGGNSDGTVFANCTFGKASLTDDQSLHVPPTKSLTCTEISMPNVLVADEAFALKTNRTRLYARLN